MTDCTACGDKCPYVQQGFCKSDTECPHYMEAWWQDQQTGNQKLVKDCAPKRLLLDSQAMFNRTISMQASIDKLEHRLAKLESLLEVLISQSKTFMLNREILTHENGNRVLLNLPENKRRGDT